MKISFDVGSLSYLVVFDLWLCGFGINELANWKGQARTVEAQPQRRACCCAGEPVVEQGAAGVA